MALPAKPSPSASASGTTPSAVAGLCAVASELTALLERETALLRAMKIMDIAPLQADKLRLTKLCGTALKSIDPKAEITKPLKEQWRAISKRLGDATIANEMALRVGHAATDKLVNAIVGHIERRQSAKNGYVRARPNAPATLRRPTLAGVAIDRHL